MERSRFFLPGLFPILENDFHHISMDKCTSSESQVEQTYFWTDHLTFCLGVGLCYSIDSENNYLIGLIQAGDGYFYQDGTEEHLKRPLLLNEKKWLLTEWLYNFLEDIIQKEGSIDLSKLSICLSNLDEDHNEYQEHLKKIMTSCLKQISTVHPDLIVTGDLDEVKFKSSQVETLFVASDGRMSTVSQALLESLEDICDFFSDNHLTTSSDIFNQKFNCLKQSQLAFKNMPKLPSRMMVDNWQSLKNLASELLRESSTQDNRSKLAYLTVIAWNPLSDKLDKDQLNKWLAKTQYQLDEDIKSQLFSQTEVGASKKQSSMIV
jgi:hypothetical protein